KTVYEMKKIIGDIPYFALLEGGYSEESIYEGVMAFMNGKPKTAARPRAAGKDTGKTKKSRKVGKSKKAVKKPVKKNAGKNTGKTKKPKKKK
ncbi:TPA: hypothetical protein HA265_05390, partial [Candidatus Woesearchaeota archaeon]|nr:hypothetical protein [Candidatus Woesearchaeota archaeon]